MTPLARQYPQVVFVNGASSDADIGADYVRLLGPFAVQYVLMTAGPDCLEARCAARRYQPGFGRWSMMAGDHLPRPYDLEFDSQSRTAAECAVELVASWSGGGVNIVGGGC
ncbi:MAG TPA: hypothetical protein VFI65_09745 [Streptosporangiaceae bacterium]|nr:hypothetical protein [Streptosporangiaceae bacterium]